MAHLTLEDKYKHAVLTLQAISQRTGAGDKHGWFDEWTQAGAFVDCRKAAHRCLKYIGEPTEMPNRRRSENK